MNNEVLFYEKQPFWKNRLLVITLILVNGLIIWGFVQQVIFGITWGNNPMSDVVLYIATGGILLISTILLMSKLQIIITGEGIYVKFLPILLKTRFFAWKDIEKSYVHQYKPLVEYGGWGVRIGWKGGVAYNVSGNIGLQLVLKNSKKILIGTNKAEELQEILKKINNQMN